MQDFEAKRKNLFDLLANEEKKLKGSILEQKSSAENDSPPKPIKYGRKQHKDSIIRNSSVERLIGKESIFKKPELPIQKCLKPRVVPDYKMNPHKWIKYSLEDTDISDRANTSAAFAFLQEIEKRKEMKDYKLEENDDDNDDDDDDGDGDEDKSQQCNQTEPSKIVFNKTAKLKRALKKPDNELDDVETQTPKFKSSTIVMPEYIIGQKPTKEKRIRLDKKEPEEKKKSNKELKLSHLLEYDDENDDDGDGE